MNLYVLLAREARRAVVFRRGPSKQVLVLAWDLATDRFREGQWLKGRIYERRCDLSPSGERLIYFAANHKPPYGTWTAVSRPPYLTALALWPKGDTWGGGGLFASENVIQLNHGGCNRELAQGRVPRGMRVEDLHVMRGEDWPIEDLRRKRDGWEPVEGERRVWRRKSPRGRAVLENELVSIGPGQGPWYRERYSVGGVDLGVLDWADWDVSGDLLVARDGCLWRVAADSPREPDPVQVADLRPLRFTNRAAPQSAVAW